MDEPSPSSSNIRALRVRVRVTGALGLGLQGPHNNVTQFYNTSSPLWRHDHTPYDVMTTPLGWCHQPLWRHLTWIWQLHLIDRSHDLLLHADWSICTTWPKCGFLIGLYRSGPLYYWESINCLSQRLYPCTRSSVMLILKKDSFGRLSNLSAVAIKTNLRTNHFTRAIQ